MIKKTYHWEEIVEQVNCGSKWIVIENKLYDVATWLKQHPGGSRVLCHYFGEDATEVFKSVHSELNVAQKYLKAFYIGDVFVDNKNKLRKDEQVLKSNLVKEFETLRIKMTEMGLFNAKYTFFAGLLIQVIVLEILGYVNLLYNGCSFLSIFITILLYAIAQAQAGWLQHDFGHSSVFKKRKIDSFVHQFILGFLKGASCHWWKHMHNQHHVKPNVIDKDPDIRQHPIFVLGEQIPVEVGKSESASKLPYDKQHKYFFAVGPPLLFPVYFQFMSFRHMYTRRKYDDIAWVMLYYTRFFWMHYSLLGLKGSLFVYFVVRIIESHWFTWVSQSNHLPMAIESDKQLPWLLLQIQATCDIEQSLFNDWFTGHLNFQIEHHLFPTMPRHNYAKAQPYVRELCRKHNIPYILKPLGTAFVDIISSLYKSGQLWKAVYQAHHM